MRVPAAGIIPFRLRETCSVREALAIIPLGRTKFYELVAEGVIKTIKVGRATRVVIRTLPGFSEAA
jgi:hypothetical protein